MSALHRYRITPGTMGAALRVLDLFPPERVHPGTWLGAVHVDATDEEAETAIVLLAEVELTMECVEDRAANGRRKK